MRVQGDAFVLMLSDFIVNQLSASNVFWLLIIKQTAWRLYFLEIFNGLEIADLFNVDYSIWFQSQFRPFSLLDTAGVLGIYESVNVLVSGISAAVFNSACHLSLFIILVTWIGKSSFQWPNERLSVYSSGSIAITSKVSTGFSRCIFLGQHNTLFLLLLYTIYAWRTRRYL